MRMSDEQDNKMEVDGEMVRPAAGEPSSEPFKDKYRDLKSKLKFLVYEHECFEVEVQRAQAKLLELSHDKSFLLDQLMRYEPVLVSDDEEREELTDLSASEDELLYSDLPHGSQPSPLATPTMKSSGTPTPSSILQPSSRSLDPSRQAISKATAIGNKQGRKQGGKNKVNSGTAVRIAKAVNRARQTTTTKPMLRQVNRVKSSVSLVVSLPRPSTGVHVESEGVITVHDTHMLPNVTQDTPAQSESPITNHTTSQPPTLIASHPPTLTASQPPTLTKVTLPSSTLGALPSSSSSSTTTSSGDSDSDESTSSSSETRNTTSVDRETATSPVQMVSEAKSSVSLLRPKAITSPVKSVPPNTETAVGTPPPLLSPLLSPTGAQMGWTKHPSDLTSPSHVGFVPLAPPLNSPTLPFSSLGKPHKSAFQLVSPRRDSTSDHTQHTDGTA